jgi:predicted nucleotidyltransferase
VLYGEALNVDSKLRRRVAKEAATLLYLGTEKEFKQAKLKAAKTIGTHFLPTNFEVAMELDKIAEAHEGIARKERLIQMRKEALEIMKIVKNSNPILTGSVWRGTIRHGSDVDITVYNDVHYEILDSLKRSGVKILKTEWMTVTKRGKAEESFHIYVETSTKQRIEIVVRSSDEINRRRKCEVFGDELKGLNIQELGQVLRDNPAQKFIPI